MSVDETKKRKFWPVRNSSITTSSPTQKILVSAGPSTQASEKRTLRIGFRMFGDKLRRVSRLAEELGDHPPRELLVSR